MRSFAGVYFLLRYLPFFYYPCQLYKIPFSFGSYLVLIFLSATLLVAIARPYKESYMNSFDTLLLGQLTFMSKMLTDDYFDGMGTQIFIGNLIPVFALVVCLLYGKILKGYKFRCTHCRRRKRNDHEIPIMTLIKSIQCWRIWTGREMKLNHCSIPFPILLIIIT